MAARYYGGGDSLMADVLRFDDDAVRARGLSTAAGDGRINAIPEKG